ncbi:M50 family metallopeptidase [Desulfitobacterium metallireducens]|uniref:Peptidase M50 n=1 Tax=Desulfitobacterium metallireducens DSM 15288 TaxID=871968 RepID=W0EEH4_9FIRM|nr:M50 family metallopeptidase [Desulfitobacterium metallireducens]AHF07918.1 peptidase M50 [Desulfitobacterium metallireducens DSM 15288]
MEVLRLRGLSIRVHPTFLLVLVAYGVLGLITQALFIFALVIGHELAHLFTAKAYGFNVVGLEIFPFGGAAYCDDLFEGRKIEESIMALAGPGFNLLLLFAAQALRWLGYWTGPSGEEFVRINFWLAAFNLLPILPLDGGRVARALFSDMFGFVRTTKALARLGQAFGAFLAILGLTLLGKEHFIENLMTFLILAAFFWLSGNKEIASARITFLRHLTRKKEELLRKGLMKSKVLTAYAETPLVRIVEELTPDRYALIHLPGKEFQMEKMLTETEVVEGMLAHGIYYPVGKL